jgi:hypothetical protein
MSVQDGGVQGYELMRWARSCAHVELESRSTGGRRRMTSREAHLLLVLATYCGKDCKCWPSIKTLAADMGLKATLVERKRKGKSIAYWRCSAVSTALDGLRDLGVVWSESGGQGRQAVRQLLFNPALLLSSVQAEDNSERADGLRSVLTEDNSDLSSVRTDLSSVSADENYQENSKPQLPEENSELPRVSTADAEDTFPPSSGRTAISLAASPDDGDGDEHLRVREAIRTSLAVGT